MTDYQVFDKVKGVLSSFSIRCGGDSYQAYEWLKHRYPLNNKLYAEPGIWEEVSTYFTENLLHHKIAGPRLICE